MPRLALLSACEKCIIDTDGTSSLIGVFSSLNVNLPPREIVPENAVSPKPWAVYTQWQFEPNELGKSFAQEIRIASPFFPEFGKARDEVRPATRSHGIRTPIPAMPIGREGNITVRVWLESAGAKVTPEHTLEIHLTRERPQ